MQNTQKIQAMKRIKEEYKDLSYNPDSNIGVSVGLPDEDNIFEWQCCLMGPKDTPYYGGMFFLKIKFTEEYPNKPPEVVFKTPIYHLNVNPRKGTGKDDEPLGHVGISTLIWWNPNTKVRQILTDIFALFYMANLDSPYGLDRADEFRFNRILYEEKIRHFISKFAKPKVANKEYDESWDFSF